MQHYTEGTMNRFTLTCGTALLLAAGVMLLPCDASAQKKKVPPKSEQAVDQPAPPSVQVRLGNTLRDVLVKYKGEKTNLGILSKVEGDYFVVEEEGVSTMHPFSAIISVKTVKPDEEEEDAAKIEIVLMR